MVESSHCRVSFVCACRGRGSKTWHELESMKKEFVNTVHIQVPSLSFFEKQLCAIRFFSSSNFSALDNVVLSAGGAAKPPLRGSPTRRGSLCVRISPEGGPRGRSRPFIIAFEMLYSLGPRVVQEVSLIDQVDMVGKVGTTRLAGSGILE